MLASSRAEQSGVRLEVNERIIDSCTALTKAIKILIQKSKTLQREIVDQGRVGAVIVDQGRVAAVIVDQGRVWPGIVDYALLLRRTIGVANCDCMHSHVLTASKKLNQKLQQFIARAYRLCAVRAPVCVHGVCVCVVSGHGDVEGVLQEAPPLDGGFDLCRQGRRLGRQRPHVSVPRQ